MPPQSVASTAALDALRSLRQSREAPGDIANREREEALAAARQRNVFDVDQVIKRQAFQGQIQALEDSQASKFLGNLDISLGNIGREAEENAPRIEAVSGTSLDPAVRADLEFIGATPNQINSVAGLSPPDQRRVVSAAKANIGGNLAADPTSSTGDAVDVALQSVGAAPPSITPKTSAFADLDFSTLSAQERHMIEVGLSSISEGELGTRQKVAELENKLAAGHASDKAKEREIKARIAELRDRRTRGRKVGRRTAFEDNLIFSLEEKRDQIRQSVDRRNNAVGEPGKFDRELQGDRAAQERLLRNEFDIFRKASSEQEQEASIQRGIRAIQSDRLRAENAGRFLNQIRQTEQDAINSLPQSLLPADREARIQAILEGNAKSKERAVSAISGTFSAQPSNAGQSTVGGEGSPDPAGEGQPDPAFDALKAAQSNREARIETGRSKRAKLKARTGKAALDILTDAPNEMTSDDLRAAMDASGQGDQNDRTDFQAAITSLLSSGAIEESTADRLIEEFDGEIGAQFVPKFII